MGEASTTIKRRRWLNRESNPLLVKELRGRMRGARAFVVLTVYLLLLSCFTSIIYYAFVAESSGPGGAADMASLGQVIFISVVLIEIFMVTFITPAFTAGAISGERERKTYELLRTTLLPAQRLVTGKLVSALTYMFLLILAAVPLESLAFVLGGVVVEELALALVLLLVSAFAFAVVGMFFSSFVRTTLVSTVLTYVIALLSTIGMPVLLVILAPVLMEPSLTSLLGVGPSPRPWITQAVLMYLFYFLAGLSPVTAALFTEIALEEDNSVWFFWTDVGSSHRIPIPSAWIVYAAVHLALALVLLLVTALRVRQQERR
jgi:ABC-2 type transport system permease protein